MNGKKARNIRKGVKQLFKLDPKQAIYCGTDHTGATVENWAPPEFAQLPQGFVKVVKGVSATLIKTCGRYKYKELKKAYG